MLKFHESFAENNISLKLLKIRRNFTAISMNAAMIFLAKVSLFIKYNIRYACTRTSISKKLASLLVAQFIKRTKSRKYQLLASELHLRGKLSLSLRFDYALQSARSAYHVANREYYLFIHSAEHVNSMME